MNTSAAEVAIQARDLTKSFKVKGGERVHAVRDLNLTIPTGEVVAFLGPNGAGKTTTLDMALGLTEPNSGSIQVFGQQPRRAVHEGRVSAVLQTGGLLRDVTVRETVIMIASTFAQHSPIDEVIARAGLSELAGRKVNKCSGGEQQRLRFALALLPNPDLLILDEPTAGMDVSARHEFWATMHAEAAEGRTVVFATHYLEEADSFAERIVLVAKGRVVADGTTEQIRSQSGGRRVSADIADGRAAEVAERLRALGGLDSVEVNGVRVQIRGGNSDDIARALLNDLGGSNLEITSGSLDDAFLSITGEATDAAEPTEDQPTAAKGSER